MQPFNVAQALSEISSAMVGEQDTATSVLTLLEHCADLVSSEAGGLLVADGGNGLQLLSATSHAVTVLELFQTQIDEGPCVEAALSGSPVSIAGGDEISARWPRFGPSVVEAGYAAVYAAPMRWRDRPLGALNMFRRRAVELSEDERALAHAFADFAAVILIRNDEVSMETAISRASAALDSRVIIEQAKGVLSHRHDLDMDEAYNHLRQLSAKRRMSLTESAAFVLSQAQRGRR